MLIPLIKNDSDTDSITLDKSQNFSGLVFSHISCGVHYLWK